MSGICGLLHLGQRLASSEDLSSVVTFMRSKGPDGQGIVVDGSAVLGHTDLRSRQGRVGIGLPLRHTETGVIVTADARLDNRNELAAALGMGNASAKGLSDSEFIMVAYLRWGIECAGWLKGDFAFGVWDPRIQELLCVRDPMGARPLCYVQNDSFFAFASDAESLLTLPGVSATPNDEHIASILVPQYEILGDRRTWTKEVRLLQPGESLGASRGSSIRLNRFRKLRPGGERFQSRNEASERFQELFAHAVRNRLVNVEKPALMMSGGMDSAGILAQARRLQANLGIDSLETYSTIDDDPESTFESRAILSMANLTGVESRLFPVPTMGGSVTRDDLLEIAWGGAHPVDNTILLPALMFLAASRNGNRSMLHGASGDVTQFAPIPYIADLLKRGSLVTAWRESRGAARNSVFWVNRSPGGVFASNLYRALVPAAARKRITSLRGRQPIYIAPFVDPQFEAEAAKVFHRYEEARHDEYHGAVEGSYSLQEVSELIASGLFGFNRVAARFGVEVADPWADQELVEFFLSLPVEFKVHDGWTKYLSRQAFERDLGEEVLWRTDKEHLGWHYVMELMRDSEERVNSLLSDDIHLVERYIDVSRVASSRDENMSKHDIRTTICLFEIATLIAWLKRVNSLTNQKLLT